jgi:RNA polymerase sigma factor (sigma-70 family)
MEKEKLVNLITEAQNGNSDALNTLFNEFYNDVYYFALKTVKSEDVACDVTQEVFIEIINTIKNLNEPAAFVTWMKQITYHQCTRYFKKKKDVLVEENEDGSTIFDTVQEDRTEFIPDEALEQKEFKQTILAIIYELSEDQRSAIMMYYFDELSVGEIAEIQGVSTGTVKSRLNYGRKAIKNSVEEYEEKHGIKLHAIPFFPFFKWLFKDTFNGTMATASAQAVATEVAASTGVAVSVGSATTVATVSTATAVTTGVATKVGGISLATKIIAGVAAAAVAVGGTVAVVSNVAKTNSKANESTTISTTVSDNGNLESAAPLTQEEIEKQLKNMAKYYTEIPPFANPSEISDIDGIRFLYYHSEWDNSKITVETVQIDEYNWKDIYTIPISEFEKQAQQFFGRSFDWKAIDGYNEWDWDRYMVYDYAYNEAAQTLIITEGSLNAGDIGYPSKTLYEITKIGENTYCVRKTEIGFFDSAPEDSSLIYQEYKGDNPDIGDGYLCYTGVVEKTFTLIDGNQWRYDSYVVIADYYDAYYN